MAMNVDGTFHVDTSVPFRSLMQLLDTETVLVGSTPWTQTDTASRQSLFEAGRVCADELRHQLHDAATARSLRSTIRRFVGIARTLPFPAERVIAAFTFMLDGVLDSRWTPAHREDVRLALMRVAIEEYYGCPERLRAAGSILPCD